LVFHYVDRFCSAYGLNFLSAFEERMPCRAIFQMCIADFPEMQCCSFHEGFSDGLLSSALAMAARKSFIVPSSSGLKRLGGYSASMQLRARLQACKSTGLAAINRAFASRIGDGP